eukprot:jgi/Tetstr1/458249/TSEL_044737.t1
MLLASGGSGYGGPAAGPRAERPTACPGSGTTPAMCQPNLQPPAWRAAWPSWPGAPGDCPRSSTLSPGTACVAARFLTALVLCLMMPPALLCYYASTPTKPWSFGDAAVPDYSGSDTILLR